MDHQQSDFCSVLSPLTWFSFFNKWLYLTSARWKVHPGRSKLSKINRGSRTGLCSVFLLVLTSKITLTSLIHGGKTLHITHLYQSYPLRVQIPHIKRSGVWNERGGVWGWWIGQTDHNFYTVDCMFLPTVIKYLCCVSFLKQQSRKFYLPLQCQCWIWRGP